MPTEARSVPALADYLAELTGENEARVRQLARQIREDEVGRVKPRGRNAPPAYNKTCRNNHGQYA